MKRRSSTFTPAAIVAVIAVIGGLLGIAVPKSAEKPTVAFLSASANRYETAQAATVLLVRPDNSGTGSGFTIRRGKNTFIWTAKHVVAGQTNMIVQRVIRSNTKKTGVLLFAARVIAVLPNTDAALLQVNSPEDAFSVAEWAEENPSPVGTVIFHVGNFYGSDFDGSVSRGIVSQVGVRPTEEGWPWNLVDQGDFRAVPGASGGPVFRNSDSAVLGIVVGGPNRGLDGIACFVPVRAVLADARLTGVAWAVERSTSPSDADLDSLAAKLVKPVCDFP